MNKSKVFLILIIMLSMIIGQNLEAAPYGFQVDDFQISGNLPGSASDNFADDTLDPWWKVQDGTPFESSGLVYLQSPGELMEPFVLDDYIYFEERSAISTIDSGLFNVTDGAGNFSASSKWNPVVPDENQFYGIQMWSKGAGTSEDISLNIFNMGANLADALGITPGLQMVLFTDVTKQSYAITEADIIGSIILGLSFDDTNNLVSAFFSLDNGSNFQSPFAPVITNLGDFDNTGWMLDGASLDVQPVPEPATMLLLGSGLVGLAGFRKKFRKK